MRLTSRGGSVECLDDPGEPSTGRPRVSVTKQEAQILAVLAANLRVLEIGTGLGMSTTAMAKTARRVTTVDIDPWVHENVWPQLDNAQFMRELPNVDYDMVFIDGDHNPEPVDADIACSLEHATKLIVCHDAKADPIVMRVRDWLHIDTEHGLAVKYL